MALQTFQRQQGRAVASTTRLNSVSNDYAAIDNALPQCQQFTSVFFETPGRGPVKKCVCNDRMFYTNLFCQCQACRNRDTAATTEPTTK